ncbi:MAG: NUDIX domain-containing protein [Bacteroidota bacterium]|nr:NUDIX domain-containing protein [Bacteroidota bacterium]
MQQQVCAGGFLVKKKKFLFGKRSKDKSWAPGVWDIVGGRSLKHEHPLFTLRRETFEEIGVTVLNAELLTSVNVTDNSKAGFFEYHIYMVTDYKGKPVNCSKEHTKIKWFTRKELNKIPIASPQYLVLLDEWLKAHNDEEI